MLKGTIDNPKALSNKMVKFIRISYEVIDLEYIKELELEFRIYF